MCMVIEFDQRQFSIFKRSCNILQCSSSSKIIIVVENNQLWQSDFLKRCYISNIIFILSLKISVLTVVYLKQITHSVSAMIISIFKLVPSINLCHLFSFEHAASASREQEAHFFLVVVIHGLVERLHFKLLIDVACSREPLWSPQAAWSAKMCQKCGSEAQIIDWVTLLSMKNKKEMDGSFLFGLEKACFKGTILYTYFIFYIHTL